MLKFAFVRLIADTHSVLATLGAILTILALAIDPFTQQVIQYEGCLQEVPNSIAAIPRSNKYLIGKTGGALSDNLDAPMSSAITVGVITPPQNVSTLISSQCQFGNCTFPEDRGSTFSTIGMCYSCKDITDRVFNASGIKGNSTSMTRNYTLRGSTIYIDNGYVLATGIETNYTLYPDALTTINILKSALLSGGYGNVTATACSLYACVKTYASHITSSVLTENLVAVSEPLTLGSTQFTNYSGYGHIRVDNQTLRNGSWQTCTPSRQNTTNTPIPVGKELTDIPKNASMPTPVNTSWWPEDCVWVFGFPARNGIVSYLGKTFDREKVVSAAGIGTEGNIHMLRLWNDGNASMDTYNEYFRGLTDSMTAVMRMNGDRTRKSWAYGKTLNMQTCVRVQWYWMIFPAAMVFLSTCFLAALVIRTFKGSHHSGWKSSALALLFCQVDFQNGELRAPLMKASEIYDISRSTQVKLTETNVVR